MLLKKKNDLRAPEPEVNVNIPSEEIGFLVPDGFSARDYGVAFVFSVCRVSPP